MKCLGATKHQDSSTIYRPTISVSLCTVCMIYVHHNMTIHVLLPSLLMFAYVCCIRYTFAFLVQSTTVSVQVKFSIKTALTSNMLPFALIKDVTCCLFCEFVFHLFFCAALASPTRSKGHGNLMLRMATATWDLQAALRKFFRKVWLSKNCSFLT